MEHDQKLLLVALTLSLFSVSFTAGFRNGEPTQIRLELVYFAQQQQARHGSPVDRSPTAAENYPDAQHVGTYTVQLIGAVSPVKR